MIRTSFVIFGFDVLLFVKIVSDFSFTCPLYQNVLCHREPRNPSLTSEIGGVVKIPAASTMFSHDIARSHLCVVAGLLSKNDEDGN